MEDPSHDEDRDRNQPDLADETHGSSGAPTDAAHLADGDGTLTGSVPAGGLADAPESGTSEPGTG